MLTRLALDSDITTICRAMRAAGSPRFGTAREVRQYVRDGGSVAVTHEDNGQIRGSIFFQAVNDDNMDTFIVCDCLLFDVTTPEVMADSDLAKSMRVFIRCICLSRNALYARTQCCNNSVALGNLAAIGFLPDENVLPDDVCHAGFNTVVVFRPGVAHVGAMVIERILAGNCAVLGE